ncbi:hypothetical protein Ana3638_03310 [Anaerocolumna sedimenticola]|uniref:5-bromo-4-chloroindolyl phosphate hydrolysis protein n=1 Tax=Anaerocolumna sedimenticola TaxID=2696063 RepID=A0A6P1TKV3_9FIRM|nr:5-bromo-4-chloroindolyl phosphate hydrolysis family protein [Anaerocolumna sedimenticola]QHQ59928.1 hypothetical protein Ana3638_03310 [Anaerocolumna sedimenticola]
MYRFKSKSVIPIYLIGLVWLIYSFSFPLYRIQDFVIAAILSFAVFFAGTYMITIKDQKNGIEYINTGDRDLDEMLETAAKNLNMLKFLSQNIINTKMAGQVKQLENVSVKILDLVKNEPNKASKASQFFNYYLSETVKILISYKEFEAGGRSGKNLTTAMTQIEEFMVKLAEAYQKILDGLYKDEVTDVSIDMEVMAAMLKQDQYL